MTFFQKVAAIVIVGSIVALLVVGWWPRGEALDPAEAGYVDSRVGARALGVSAALLFIAASIVVTTFLYRRNARRMAAILEEGAQEPAFTERLAMKALRQGAQLEAIRGKVAKVCVMRNMGGSPTGTGSALSYSFASFVIDTRGISHDLEESAQHHKVEANAQWLAEALGVEFEDISYG